MITHSFLKFGKYFFLFLGFLLFFHISIKATSAQTTETIECNDASFSIIARDSSGNFIPNISVDVFEQVIDADNNPKPGTKITSGKTSSITGKFSAIIKKPTGKEYAIKMNSIGKDESAFYFYNSLSLDCGDNKEVSKTLSAINVVIRDSRGNLRTNEQFSLYSQKYNADNNPLKEKGSLLATLNTGESGKIIIYVPAGSNFINNSGNAYYIFEKIGVNGGIFTKYDILVNNGNTTDVEYKLSSIKLEVQDVDGVAFPANSKVELFTQTKDENYNSILGIKIKDIFTDDFGNINFEYPAGIYSARLLGESGVYTYFWDLEIIDQRQTVYALKTNEAWLPNSGACSASSNFTLYTRDTNNSLISGLSYNIYEQGLNADNKPYAIKKLSSGKINESGESTIVINPDPRKKYALQIYEKNENVGDFWYFDQFQFSCGQNLEITKQLPALNVILRKSNGELLKNQQFSLYTQKYDADDKPIKEKKDLISDSFNSGDSGEVTVYLSANHPYLKDKHGSYVLVITTKEKITFTEYDINVNLNQNLNLEYTLSDLVINYKNAEGKIISEKSIDIYEQLKNPNSQNILGKKIVSQKSDSYGVVHFEYPAGNYAVVVSDDEGQKNIFWNIIIKSNERTNINIIENKTKINIKDSSGKKINKKTTVGIALLKEGKDGYILEKKLKSLNTDTNGTLNISLAPGAYLFSIIDQKIDYGKTLYIENGKTQILDLKISSEQKINFGQIFKLGAVNSNSLSEKMKGRLLLQVEKNGETWYVEPNSLNRYYIKDGASAYETLRKFGLGITNTDLNKIPVGLDARFEEWDYDGDLVPDKMEEAIGTDMYNYDTDGDGYNDGQELLSGYSPRGNNKLTIDNALAKRLSGKILLQTESRGEAWYLNPSDNRRYYMKDGDSAYEIMRFLSLGITNENLEKIQIGK